MMDLTGKQRRTSDQHQEFGLSRQKRDCNDTRKVIQYLEQVSPFKEDPSVLRSISTGVSAFGKTNVQEAKRVGSDIIASMVGVTVADFTPRKANQCITMTSKIIASNSDKKSQLILHFCSKD